MKDNPCIRIGHLKIVDHLLIGIAGLPAKDDDIILSHSTLEPVAMTSWNQISDGLKEGTLTGAFITAPLAMDLFAAGLDIRALMSTHRGGGVMIKNRTTQIGNMNNFKNKTMLVSSKLCIQNMLLHRMLSSAGLTFGPHDDAGADVVWEVVNPFLMPQMLADDQEDDIAGFAVSDPFGSQTVHQGAGVKICTSQSLWKNHMGSLFVLQASFIKDHVKAVKEIISLFVQKGQLIEETKTDEILSDVCHFLDQDKEITKAALIKTNIRFNPSLLIPDIDALDIIQNYMADSMGVLTHKINIPQLVDNSFVLSAMPEKHK